ncbi:MAG: Dihydroanticapsin 7-dehydrogenase [Alphaproteobacteria bacterium MarineAlpha4_Bin2]|nr:MAG: Dihydroanticapsin 7-dehydrogenase [Alphaproteobacteria bacterium MarineAlpha4_Bin2]
MNRLDGKVAIVTGGGGGIGRATTARFVQEGAKVLVADIDERAGTETTEIANSQAGKGDGEAIFRRTDVSDNDSMAAAVVSAREQFGKLSILHNNAGGSTNDDGPIADVTDDEFWRAIKLDLYGTFLGCRHAIPALRESGGGSIINMSSVVALMAFPGRDAYTAAKGGIAAITRSTAVEYGKDKIRVNAIAPTVILTERVKKLFSNQEVKNELEAMHVLGFGEPMDIAEMAVYLASNESRLVTGQIFPVDSGLTVK